jgi:hypothetical protein
MKKVIFWTTFLFIILATSILATYMYGYFHNKRYWQTISSVQKIEINAMKGLLQLDLDKMIKTNNYSTFIDIFKNYYGKLYIEIMVDDNIVFQNRDRTREIGLIEEKLNVNNKNGKILVIIKNYKATSWNDTFLQWINLKNITKWFSPKLNYITLSFLAFFFISLPTWFAILYFYKAQHESKLLRSLMEELDYEEGQ